VINIQNGIVQIAEIPTHTRLLRSQIARVRWCPPLVEKVVAASIDASACAPVLLRRFGFGFDHAENGALMSMLCVSVEQVIAKPVSPRSEAIPKL
jgi:hypothetical protein